MRARAGARWRLGLLTSLLVGAGLAPRPADAQVATVACPQNPSIAACHNAQLYNGCGASFRTKCEPVLRMQASNWVSQRPQSSVTVGCAQGTPPAAPPPTAFEDYAIGERQTETAGSAALSADHDQESLEIASAPSVQWGTARNAHRRPAWKNNGERIQSCEEYADELFHDWNRFLDAAAACTGNPRCVFQVATENPGGSVSQQHARLRDRTLRSRNGQAMPVLSEYWFPDIPGTIPKNLFFAAAKKYGMLHYGRPSALGASYSQYHLPSRALEWAHHIAREAAYRTRPAWVRARAARRMEELQSLLARKEYLERILGSVNFGGSGVAPPGAEMAHLAEMLRRLEPPNHDILGWIRDQIGMRSIDLATLPGVSLPASVILPAGATLSTTGVGLAGVTAAGATAILPGTTVSVLPAGAAPPAGATPWLFSTLPSYSPPVSVEPPAGLPFVGRSYSCRPQQYCPTVAPAASLADENANLLCRIRSLLGEEYYLKETGQGGCFDPTEVACDWSYEAFEARAKAGLAAVISRAQEAAFLECEQWASKPVDRPNLGALQANIRANRQAVAEVRKNVPNNGGTPLVLGETRSVSRKWGDRRKFASRLVASAYWEAKQRSSTGGTPKMVCTLGGKAGGTFKVQVTTPVSGREWQTLADASARVDVKGTSTGKTSLQILGTQLLSSSEFEVNQVVRKDPAGRRSTAKLGFSVPILGFDVNVSVWLELAYGGAFRLEQARPATGCQARFRANATFSPSMSVEGALEVGVGIPVVLSAGVVGRVRLIGVNFPTTVNVGLKTQSSSSLNDTNNPVRIDVDSKAILSTLGGHVSLYGEVLGIRGETRLFRWKGKEYSFPILQPVGYEATSMALRP